MTRAPAATPASMPGYAAPLAGCDRVAVTTGGEFRITGSLRIPAGGPYLSGHFPEITIFPGVFILEAVSQAVVRACGDPDGSPLRLHRITSLRFLNPLYPGDELSFTAVLTGPAGWQEHRDGALAAARRSGEPVVVTADCRRGDNARAATMTLELRW